MKCHFICSEKVVWFTFCFQELYLQGMLWPSDNIYSLTDADELEYALTQSTLMDVIQVYFHDEKRCMSS